MSLLRRGRPRSCPPFLLQRGYPSGAKHALGHPTARLPGCVQRTCPALLSQSSLRILHSDKSSALTIAGPPPVPQLRTPLGGPPCSVRSDVRAAPTCVTRDTGHRWIFAAYGKAGEGLFMEQALSRDIPGGCRYCGWRSVPRPQTTNRRGLDWRPCGNEHFPAGPPEGYARALTACSIRSIPFSMFFMDMA